MKRVLINFKMKVAYLGPEKTFTEQAARRIFPEGKLEPRNHIRRVILAVESGEVGAGVVPLENYYGGKVVNTLSAFFRYCQKAGITQERAFEVVHCIGALKNHHKIMQVLSKDQALEQCDDYLASTYPDAVAMARASTAEAAQYISSSQLLDAAAIAPREALVKNGLEVLAEDICPNNKTRFVVLGREQTQPTGDDKTFIIFHPPVDRPGVLHACLSFPSLFGINLEDLVPRPDGKGGYYFCTEMDGHIQDTPVRRTVDNIRFYLDKDNKHPDAVKVLGSYRNTHWKK